MDILKLVKELGFETLPTLNEFRKRLIGVTSRTYEIRMNAYGDLIDQPNSLGKYIPSDKDGKPMEEPKQWSNWVEYVGLDEPTMHPFTTEDMVKFKEYQQAVDRVIFEGWMYVIFEGGTYVNLSSSVNPSVINSFINLSNGGITENQTIDLFVGGRDYYKTIEQFINSGGKLTPKIK